MPRPAPMPRAARRATRQVSDGDPTIVIGIDFGTTFSGVAWARSTRPDLVNIVTSWKSSFIFNSDREKVSTSIAYSKESESPLWGYAAPVGSSTLNWFKLCIIDEEDIPLYLRASTHLQTVQAALERLGTHAVEVISHYLRELWNYTLGCIERAEGASIVELSAFKVIVTLPAIWPAYAQFRMKEAIQKAGILSLRNAADTTVEFISEPEAAALATLRDMSDRADMRTGDHFVVCDAGGGTVDVITYTIISQTPMKVRESVKGDGKLCGATFVDERFRHLLKNKISPASWQKLGEDGVTRLINNEWENGIKSQFCNDGRKWTIQLPIASRKRDHDQFSCPEIIFSNQEIVDVFSPIMNQTVELVTAQIQEVKSRYRKLPKFVILVGGFGRCQHLYNCLRQGLRDNVEILQSSGARPWTAVCRGAAIRGLEKSDNTADSVIYSRIARASYGTMCNVPWCEGKHDGRDKEFCPITEEDIAADQTSWFLRIGDTMKVGRSMELPFHQDFEEPMESVSTELIYSNATTPSSRCDETVKELCQVRWSSVPKYEELPSWKNSKGRLLKRLTYTIKMTSNGVSLDFEISHKGKVVASKNVAVDYRESGTTARRADSHVDGDGDGDGDDSSTYAPSRSERSEATNQEYSSWDNYISTRIPQR
ncbi:hypothetical protein Trihar35433_410 [Trichoderma harzianum]|nr:hypothetical protein Trihar35433_410 [Trichoderma harzianum]